jgi:hypothetical protein
MLPARRFGLDWVLDLSTADHGAVGARYHWRGAFALEERSLAVLRREQ